MSFSEDERSLSLSILYRPSPRNDCCQITTLPHSYTQKERGLIERIQQSTTLHLITIFTFVA